MQFWPYMQNININLEVSCTIIFANKESILFPSISQEIPVFLAVLGNMSISCFFTNPVLCPSIIRTLTITWLPSSSIRPLYVICFYKEKHKINKTSTKKVMKNLLKGQIATKLLENRYICNPLSDHNYQSWLPPSLKIE